MVRRMMQRAPTALSSSSSSPSRGGPTTTSDGTSFSQVYDVSPNLRSYSYEDEEDEDLSGVSRPHRVCGPPAVVKKFMPQPQRNSNAMPLYLSPPTSSSCTAPGRKLLYHRNQRYIEVAGSTRSPVTESSSGEEDYNGATMIRQVIDDDDASNSRADSSRNTAPSTKEQEGATAAAAAPRGVDAVASPLAGTRPGGVVKASNANHDRKHESPPPLVQFNPKELPQQKDTKQVQASRRETVKQHAYQRRSPPLPEKQLSPLRSHQDGHFPRASSSSSSSGGPAPYHRPPHATSLMTRGPLPVLREENSHDDVEDEHSAYYSSLGGLLGEDEDNNEAVSESAPVRTSAVVNFSHAEKNEMLFAMRNLVLKQQTALQDLLAQNQLYRTELGVAHKTIVQLQHDRHEARQQLEDAMLEKEAFEAETVWLREEIKTLRHVRHHNPASHDGNDGRATGSLGSASSSTVGSQQERPLVVTFASEEDIDAYMRFKDMLLQSKEAASIAGAGAKVLRTTSEDNTINSRGSSAPVLANLPASRSSGALPPKLPPLAVHTQHDVEQQHLSDTNSNDDDADDEGEVQRQIENALNAPTTSSCSSTLEWDGATHDERDNLADDNTLTDLEAFYKLKNKLMENHQIKTIIENTKSPEERQQHVEETLVQEPPEIQRKTINFSSSRSTGDTAISPDLTDSMTAEYGASSCDQRQEPDEARDDVEDEALISRSHGDEIVGEERDDTGQPVRSSRYRYLDEDRESDYDGSAHHTRFLNDEELRDNDNNDKYATELDDDETAQQAYDSDEQQPIPVTSPVASPVSDRADVIDTRSVSSTNSPGSATIASAARFMVMRETSPTTIPVSSVSTAKEEVALFKQRLESIQQRRMQRQLQRTRSPNRVRFAMM